MVPLKLFLSDSPMKSFQVFRAGMPGIDIDCRFKDYGSLVCYTNNLSTYEFAKNNSIAKMGYIF